MQRVAVVGSGGAGKTTFAAELGHRLGIPVVHLDRHFWRPGWVETPADEWREVQLEIVSRETWIVEGNYGGTFDIRFERADAVIVLGVGRLRCLCSAMWRSLTNLGKPVQADGCRERISLEFYRWIWHYPRDSRPRLDAALVRHREHLRVIELHSRRETAAFLDGLGG